MGYPSAGELTEVLTRTTEGARAEVNKVLDRETLLELQKLVRQVPVATHVKDYAVRLVLATHPKTETAAPITNQYLRFGSSPRGGQCLLLAGKVRALTQGRFNVSLHRHPGGCHAALRHRLILNFEAEAEGITTDQIVAQILQDVPKDAAAVARTVTCHEVGSTDSDHGDLRIHDWFSEIQLAIGAPDGQERN